MTRLSLCRVTILAVILFSLAFLFPTEAAGRADSSVPPFLPAATYDAGGSYPESVAAGDLNGDHILDLVVTTRRSVGVILSNGDDTFQPVVTYPASAFYVYQVAVGDVNRDGKLDVVTAYGGNGMMGVFLGNGDGTLRAETTYDTGNYGARALALADLDADGILDLVVTNDCGGEQYCAGAVVVLAGNGDGSFRAPQLYDSALGGGFSVAVADINGDGQPDVVVSYFTSCRGCADSIGVLLGKGDGTLLPLVNYRGVGGGAIAVADANGDGNPDLFVTSACVRAGNCGDAVVGVMLGDGTGNFQAPVNYGSGGYHPSDVVVADVDADQKPDLLVTNGCSFRGHQCQEGNIGILLGNGDGTFQLAIAYAAGGHYVTALVAADVNGDGRLDIIDANARNYYDTFTVGVLLNNGGPHSPTVTTLVSSQNPAQPGTALTFSSTVKSSEGKTLAGFVTFISGYHPMAKVPLVNGEATYTFTPVNYGAKWMEAAYSGDTRNAESSAGLIEYIKSFPIQTILKLKASPSPSVVGQPVTFTAQISTYGDIPDGGLVTFYDWKTPMGSVPVVGGFASFTTSSLNAGSHYIKAIYAGNEMYKKSSAHLEQVVDSQKNK